MPLQHFVKTSKNGMYHIKRNGWSICYHMFSSSYPNWSSSMLAYYGPGASSAFYASAVASPTSHPYLWGGQNSSITLTTGESEGKVPDGKDRTPSNSSTNVWLLPAWDTPSGIPYNIINLAHGNAHNPGWTGGDSILADSGTEQLEFIALSQRTGDPKYQLKAENVIAQLNKTFPADGLLPIYINPHKGTTSYSTITFGAMGDSFYEYLLKVWIQGNRTAAVKHYREMWETSMKGLLSLVRRTTPSSFAYIAEKMGNSLTDKMDELACFAPGMIALGSSGYDPDNSQKFLSLAEELAWTCYNFYQSTPTKLAGENYFFHAGQDMSVGTSWNILRPETVESLFYLWRLTGNKTYQEWGWNIFQAFEKNSRIESGYVGLKDVNSGVKDNMMQSFFLAETLKYLYLLFSPTSVISLDEWVFNTEAHPIRIVTRHGPGDDSETDEQHKLKLRARKEGRFGN